jgi:hypothetical protein
MACEVKEVIFPFLTCHSSTLTWFARRGLPLIFKYPSLRTHSLAEVAFRPLAGDEIRRL